MQGSPQDFLRLCGGLSHPLCCGLLERGQHGWRRSSVLDCPLDSIEEVGERRILVKMSSIMDNTPQNRGWGVLTAYRMLTHASLLYLVYQSNLFTPVDLKEVYFHIPVYPHHRKFLRFVFWQICYEYQVLPFGLSLNQRVAVQC